MFYEQASDRSSPHSPGASDSRGLRTELLNARWHGTEQVRGSRRCGVCLEPVLMDEHVVRRAGEALHAACTSYGLPVAAGAFD